MTINEGIFKAYDIRGIYPDDINEKIIGAIVLAIYRFLTSSLGKTSLTVVLGRDMRVSSPSLFEKAKETLLQEGATVIDVDLVSTPTFYYAVLKGKYDAGIQISASHNPKEYNGIKIVKREGDKLLKIGKTTGMEEIKKMVLSQPRSSSGSEGGVIKKDDAVQEEVFDALESVKPQNIKKLKIVADPANAMGALYLEELAKKIPMELVKMNFELDGTFPAHQPDPLQFDTLSMLRERVKLEKADLGIAPDGDGDRIFFINERGEVVPATLITSLIAKEILTKSPGETIIADIRDIMNVRNICQKYNGVFSMSKVGHALITGQLNKEGAAFAGESSGHFYFRETGGAESSVRVILYLLETLGKSGKTVSQLLEKFHTAFESGEYNFERKLNVDPKALLENLSAEYPDGKISWLDGLSVDYPDWRFNLRASNTEPLLRLNLEANTKSLMEEKLDEVLQKLRAAGAVRK